MERLRLITIIFFILMIVGWSFAGYLALAKTATPSQQTRELTIAGSTTVAPICEEWARVFMEKYPNVKITVVAIGSGPGIKACGTGEADIGMSSRDVKPAEFEKYPNLKVFPIGMDGVAVVVHPTNPITELTKEQVAKIFAGEITNWKEVGGLDQKIHVYTREEGSGTRHCFEKGFLKPFKKEIFGGALVGPSNPEMRVAVSKDPQAIGYLSFGFLDPSIKTPKIDGVEATVENLLKGKYPAFRTLYVLTNGEPDLVEEAFIGFGLSEEGQKVVKELGYIPLYER